jgi:hypothetical protein
VEWGNGLYFGGGIKEGEGIWVGFEAGCGKGRAKKKDQ